MAHPKMDLRLFYGCFQNKSEHTADHLDLRREYSWSPVLTRHHVSVPAATILLLEVVHS